MEQYQVSTSEDTKPAWKKYPFYMKATVILFGISLFFFMLYMLGDVLIPLCFAGLLAILLNPLNSWLRKIGIPKIYAITICVILLLAVFAGIIWFLSTQIAQFADMGPKIEEKVTTLGKNAQTWVVKNLNVEVKTQNKIINTLTENGTKTIGSSILSVFSILSVLILIPMYVFLLLYYKPILLNFIYESFDDPQGNKVEEILMETKAAVQSYVSGLMIETMIIAALNSGVLLLLGVKYAILLGVLGALLNIIPYIGGILAIVLPVLFHTVTASGWETQLYIIGAYLAVQFVDNYIIVPRIVSSKVSVNAFISIVSVLLGGALWGVAGMFLSVPFVAVCKIIFDRVEGLKPFGKLLGIKMPGPTDAIQKTSHVLEESEISDISEEYMANESTDATVWEQYSQVKDVDENSGQNDESAQADKPG